MSYHCFINHKDTLPTPTMEWKYYNLFDGFVPDIRDATHLLPDDILVIEDMFTNGGAYKHTKFYGIQLIETIRVRHQLKNRIILLSPTPTEMLLGFQQRHKLFTPLLDAAVAILPSYASKAEIKTAASNMSPLSDAGLEDARLSLYALPGFISNQLLHDWKFGQSEADYKGALEKLLPYLFSQQQSVLLAKGYSHQLISVSDFSDFNIQRSRILNEISYLLTGNTNNSSNNNQTNLRLLLVEDDAEQLEQIKAILGKKFIVEGHATADTAIAALREDSTNDIIAVVADWRLVVPGTAKRQNAQGYDVLQAAAVTGVRALFALTSLEDNQLVHGIRDKMDCKITFLQKHYFFNDTVLQAGYLNDIESGCRNAIDQTFPKVKAWRANGLHQQYIDKRMSVGWVAFLNKIETDFRLISQNIKKERAESSNIKLYTPIANNGGPALSDNDLYAVLLYRRFYLWFNKLLGSTFKKDHHRSDAIFDCLRGVGESSSKGFFINQLCLKSKDLFSNLLAEEKEWYRQLKP